jgi:type VI secretion system protein ImpJ
VINDIEVESAEVHWYEGMLLQPHHFQTQRRRSSMVDREKMMHLVLCWWGVADLQINPTALVGFRIKVDGAVLRLKDGTWLNIPNNAYAEERSFMDITSQLDESIPVWFSVKRAEPNRPLVHVLNETNKGIPRPFVLKENTIVDENSGENGQVIQSRLWNVQITFGPPPGDQFEAIKVGELVWSSAKQPMFNIAYIPPLLNIGASAYLRDRVKNVVVKIRNQATFLQGELVSRRISLTNDPIRVLANLTRLQIMASYSLVLQQLLNMNQTPPFSLYMELVRLFGELVVLYPDTPLEVPAYDHDNLWYVMETVIKLVERMVEGGVVVDYIHRRFEVDGERRFCRIDKEWLDPEPNVRIIAYLCINTDMSESSVDAMLSDYRVKIGPPSRIDEMLIARTRGLNCQRLRRIPSGLPDRSGLHYFQVDLSRQSEFWQDLYRDLLLVIHGIPVETTSDISLYVHVEKGER